MQSFGVEPGNVTMLETNGRDEKSKFVRGGWNEKIGNVGGGKIFFDNVGDQWDGRKFKICERRMERKR